MIFLPILLFFCFLQICSTILFFIRTQEANKKTEANELSMDSVGGVFVVLIGEEEFLTQICYLLTISMEIGNIKAIFVFANRGSLIRGYGVCLPDELMIFEILIISTVFLIRRNGVCLLDECS